MSSPPNRRTQPAKLAQRAASRVPLGTEEPPARTTPSTPKRAACGWKLRTVQKGRIPTPVTPSAARNPRGGHPSAPDTRALSLSSASQDLAPCSLSPRPSGADYGCFEATGVGGDREAGVAAATRHGQGDRAWVQRAWQKLRGALTRGWLLVGALVGVGILPCPDCGGPMIVHYWPIAALAVAFQTLRRRRRGKMSTEEEET